MLCALGLLAGCQDLGSTGITGTDDGGAESDAADGRDLAHIAADGGVADSGVRDAAGRDSGSASDGGNDGGASDGGASDGGSGGGASDGGTVPPGDLGPSTCGNGTQQWAVRAATKLNTSSGNLILRDVSVRPDGDIWVTGTLSGAATFGEGTAYQQTLTGGDGILVARYASDGTFRWGRVWQSAYNSFASGTQIRALADGGAMVVASFEATVKLDAGLASEVSFTAAGGTSDYDLVLARLAADGHVVWARQAGGGGQDFPQALDVTPDGKSVLVGRFADAFAHDVTVSRGRPDAITRTAASTAWETLFLAQYDASGNLGWVSLAGGTSRDDEGRGVVYLGDGSVVLSGSFTSDMAFDGLATTYTGAYGARGFFVARWSHTGAISWARVLPTGARGSTVALGPDGALWVLVHTSGTAVFGKGESTETTLTGSGNDAIARYDLAGNFLGVATFATSSALHDLPSMVLIGNSAYLGGDEYYDITFATTPNATTVSSVGWEDAITLCASAGGQVGWWKRAGSNQHDYVHAVAATPNGELVTVGEYDAPLTFSPGSPGAVTLAKEALFSESFLARYGP